jgi:uncharacterized protein (DUF2141 family)
MMKPTRFPASRIVLGILALLMTMTHSPLPAQAPKDDTLTIRVVGARNTKGTIRVALFRSGEGFPGDASKAIRLDHGPIDAQTLSSHIVLGDLPAGVYAVSVFHDENMNGKLDKNLMGIPKEGYGASNNPERKMRAPTFEEAKFSLKANQSLEIRLNY